MVLSAAIALLITAITTPVVIAVMRRLAVVDTVTERSSHLVPTYRGGGVAIALGLFAGMLVPIVNPDVDAPADLFTVVVAASLFGLLGLAEDTHGVAALRRLGLQMVAAAVTIAAWVVVAQPDLPVATIPLAACAALVWIAGFTNAFNFMDGINGISSAQTLLTGVAFAIIGHRSGLDFLTYGGAMAAGVALGFGPYNFPRARIFLGDVGSYALGALIAVLALLAVGHGVRPDAVVAPLLVYLADTSCTLLRRVRSGQVWYAPHRGHVYQLLTVAGWSHTRATLVVSSVTVATTSLGLVIYSADVAVRVAADIVAILLVRGYLLLPRHVARGQQQPRAGATAPGRHRAAKVGGRNEPLHNTPAV
ncbi:MraY family glycosyltransferase [Protofrankia symbiont of Coriaria ruscifolia]|uniref:Glycosyl transferase family protein n=1 Tax=Candidatus Protofrankia californiensis TaxID=1839754 RepID=A0A1C3NXQ6_9ACTN|nr:glycosyltransferase family 4 protein [Protofrankia symbiont of Coriaria ruscifolia]SBW22372.1 glycosyl transferase family protein [Candidatus Protofrankia californiensis]